MPTEQLLKLLTSAVTGFASTQNPMLGVFFGWAEEVGFELYDQIKSGAEPVVVAQLASDRCVDLVEKLKVGA
jgi:hypothetical protein